MAGLIDGGVEAVLGELPDVRDQFPGPFDGFFFEIIAEAPVAEHLEKGVVIGVQADVVEVVVFAAGADAFLGVGRAGGAAGDGTRPICPRRARAGRGRWARTGSCRRW